MPIIFFDVDGPMVSGRALFLPENIVPSYGWQFDPCAVGMLNFLGWAVPDLQVVIASHRVGMICPHTTSKGTMFYRDWVEIFKYNGLNLPIHKDWITRRSHGIDQGNRPKIVEIQEWLKDHPEVQKFVTIDDEAAGYDDDPTPRQRRDFHICAEHYLDGITWADLKRAADYLGVKNVEQMRDKYRKHIIASQGHHGKTNNAGSRISSNTIHPDFSVKVN